MKQCFQKKVAKTYKIRILRRIQAPKCFSFNVLKFELFVDKSGCIHCWEFYILRALINANKITINRVYKTTSYPGLLLLKEYKMKHKHNYDACIQYLTSHSYVVFHQQRHWNIIDDQSFDCSIFVVLKVCSIRFNKCHIHNIESHCNRF